MPRKVESMVGEAHDYYRFLVANPPDDFPLDRFSHLSPPVINGMRQLWIPVHMRRFLAETYSDVETRRLSEWGIRERAADLREVRPETDKEKDNIDATIGRLMLVHQLSVTADQAELCAASFVQ
jgi:hypothetical protein